MKKTVLSVIALSMITTPALAADRHDDRRDNGPRTVIVQQQAPAPRYQAPGFQADRFQANRYQAQQHRNWRKGERFDYRQARNYRVINDYRARHLKAPPRGYRYVQSGNDAVLVGITTGLIAAIFAGAIH